MGFDLLPDIHYSEVLSDIRCSPVHSEMILNVVVVFFITEMLDNLPFSVENTIKINILIKGKPPKKSFFLNGSAVKAILPSPSSLMAVGNFSTN